MLYPRDFNPEQPPTNQPCTLLCEAPAGNYVLPFACKWPDGAWYNVSNKDDEQPIAVKVLGWRLSPQIKIHPAKAVIDYAITRRRGPASDNSLPLPKAEHYCEHKRARREYQPNPASVLRQHKPSASLSR
jgi:hypothetical protein